MATHAAKLRMLEEMQASNIQRSKESLAASTTAQIEEVLQSSMKRRDKRSALYKIRRNAETVADETCRRFHREYEMFGIKTTLTATDFLSNIDFSLLLTENVTVHEIPSHELQLDVPIKVEPLDAPFHQVSEVQYIPISLQPIVPIVDYAYKELTAGSTRKERTSVPFHSYYELTIQQVLSYIGSYGEGVSYFPREIYEDLPDYNHHLVVDYLSTLRPCSAGRTKFVGKLLSHDHPAYHILGAKEKGNLGRFYRSSNAAVSQAFRRKYLDSIFALYNKNSIKISEKRNLIKKIPYSEDWSGSQGGGLNVLVHLLLWLRKDVVRQIDSNKGDESQFHHGYFYDPYYGTSYLTFSNPTLVQEIREASHLALRKELGSAPTRLPNQ